jgi:hypothetical protein
MRKTKAKTMAMTTVGQINFLIEQVRATFYLDVLHFAKARYADGIPEYILVC